MTELQQNRYDQLLRRVGGLIGAKSMVNDALTELFPMVDVEDLKAELALISGSRLAFSSTFQLADPVDLNHSQLFNPTDSNNLIVLERLDIRASIAQNIEYQLATVALADFTANHALRDTRLGIPTAPVGQVRSVEQAGGLAQFGLIWEDTNGKTIEDKRGLFVLAPGTGLTIATTVANADFIVSYLWRERVAETSELQF